MKQPTKLPRVSFDAIFRLEVTKPTHVVTPKEITEHINTLADFARPYIPGPYAASKSDRVAISFDGGLTTNTIILGSRCAAEGLEAALEGRTAGDVVPASEAYPETLLLEVAQPGEPVIDDKVARILGADTEPLLRVKVAADLDSQYRAVSDAHARASLQAALDSPEIVSLPKKLVDEAFERSWRELLANMAATGETFGRDNTASSERARVRKSVKRSLRLGVVYSAVPRYAALSVTDAEVGAFLDEDGTDPSTAAMRLDAMRNNEVAFERLRRILLETKTTSYLLGTVVVREVQTTRDGLLSWKAEPNTAETMRPCP